RYLCLIIGTSPDFPVEIATERNVSARPARLGSRSQPAAIGSAVDGQPEIRPGSIEALRDVPPDGIRRRGVDARIRCDQHVNLDKARAPYFCDVTRIVDEGPLAH